MSYCVVFRTGGTANYKWQRTLALQLRESAETVVAAVKRAGYPAHIEDYDRSVAIGLPEGFTYEDARKEQAQ